MFGTASKPFASLSSGLLARKGQARPAMRPQAIGGFVSAEPMEDLGWNDMGAIDPVAPSPEPAPVAEAAPAPVVAPIAETVVPEAPTIPPVLQERRALAEEFADVKPLAPLAAERVARESAKQTKKGRAAFTLRLDAERHLRLRLASAAAGRSAQQLVTAALDDMLKNLPDIEKLAEQLAPVTKNNR